MKDSKIYGLMAEFVSPEELLEAEQGAAPLALVAGEVVEAAERTYKAGYRKIDAYSPFPIEELSEAIGFHSNGVAPICLVGGLLGCIGGFMLQWWINTINYPVNIGGRPYNSWPAFIIVTFEMTILFGGLAAVAGMLMLNGLPQPYHPVFNVPQFSAVTRDRFFVLIF